MAPVFNPADYALKPEEFPADKESTWTYPAEKDGWCYSHLALKNEINMFLEALEAVESKGNPLAAWEVTSLQTAFAAHHENVHWHHHDEDDNFVPFMKQRVKYPEKLEADHGGIESLCDSIKTEVEALKEGDKVGSIVGDWKKYKDMIFPHMDEEERTALLLMRAFFEQKDLKPVVEYIVANGPKIEVGSMAYAIGEETFRDGFMKQEKIPFFVWYIDFQFRYKVFLDRFVKHIEAIKSGKEPAPSSSAPGFMDNCIIL